MEPKYSVSYRMTFEEYLYMARHPRGKTAANNRKRGIRLRLLGCAASGLLILIGALQREFYLFLLGMFCICIFLARLFVVEKPVLKKQYSLLLKAQPDGIWIERFDFYDDYLQVVNGRAESRYDYREFMKIDEDERYIFAWLNEDMGIRIPKNSVADAASLMSFLQQKHAALRADTHAKRAGVLR